MQKELFMASLSWQPVTPAPHPQPPLWQFAPYEKKKAARSLILQQTRNIACLRPQRHFCQCKFCTSIASMKWYIQTLKKPVIATTCSSRHAITALVWSKTTAAACRHGNIIFNKADNSPECDTVTSQQQTNTTGWKVNMKFSSYRILSCFSITRYTLSGPVSFTARIILNTHSWNDWFFFFLIATKAAG